MNAITASGAALWHGVRRRIGTTGFVAIVLAVVTVGLLLLLPPLLRDGQAQRAQLMAEAAAAAARPPMRAPVAPSEQLRRFVAGFPPFSQNARDLDKVFECAQRHNLQLPKGEYKLKRERGAPFVTYTATFPVHNDYNVFKDFTAEVLRSLPHVSMDELRLSRHDAGTTSLDAVVRFTFVYRGS